MNPKTYIFENTSGDTINNLLYKFVACDAYNVTHEFKDIDCFTLKHLVLLYDNDGYIAI